MTEPQEENPPFEDEDLDGVPDDPQYAPRPEQPAVQDDGEDIQIPDDLA